MIAGQQVAAAVQKINLVIEAVLARHQVLVRNIGKRARRQRRTPVGGDVLAQKGGVGHAVAGAVKTGHVAAAMAGDKLRRRIVGASAVGAVEIGAGVGGGHAGIGRGNPSGLGRRRLEARVDELIAQAVRHDIRTGSRAGAVAVHPNDFVIIESHARNNRGIRVTCSGNALGNIRIGAGLVGGAQNDITGRAGVGPIQHDVVAALQSAGE